MPGSKARQEIFNPIFGLFHKDHAHLEACNRGNDIDQIGIVVARVTGAFAVRKR